MAHLPKGMWLPGGMSDLFALQAPHLSAGDGDGPPL